MSNHQDTKTPSEVLQVMKAWRKTIYESFKEIDGVVREPRIIHEMACIDEGMKLIRIVRDIRKSQIANQKLK